MSDSYMFRFRNKINDKNFQLDIWKILNFIKTETNRHLESKEFGDTCELIQKIHREAQCGEEESS